MKVRLLKVNLPTTTELVVGEAMEDIGISAGICYMPDTYDALVERGTERNIKTADFATGNGHHSVADHIQCTFVIEDCSKILAMLLNSIGCYGTSEKSGRYTVMKNCDMKERVLYDKWVIMLTDLISKKYPDIAEKQVGKLAMENARLFLSVFAPSTTMKYTIGLKDINYIIDWCEKFFNDTTLPNNYFYDTLKKELKILECFFSSQVWLEPLRDHKNRKFDFLDARSYACTPKINEFGDSYTTHYKMSFVGIAQGERHRTLVYRIFFNGEAKEFYVPEIIEDEALRQEWVEDMISVSDRIPQGTIVGVKEQGTLERFMLKCTERMCGRAQLEISRQTVKTFELYHSELETKVLDKDMEEYTESLDKLSILEPCVRCGFMKCKEPCMWGKNANKRLI